MTDFNIPSGIRIEGSVFTLEFNTQTFESPTSNWVQRNELSGARWQAQYTLTAYGRDESKLGEIKAFLAKLRGKINRFNGFDPDRRTPLGSASSAPGNPLVVGGGQTGNELDIDGIPVNTIGYLLPGDYFSIGNELKMVTSSVDSDGSGAATIMFEPALRNSPADNDALTVSNCTTPMILDTDMAASWTSDKNGIHRISFSGTEAFA